MGPLIAILKSLIEDIIKYFILYGVFFIPYTICFFVLFGGVQSKNLEGADDLTSYPRVAVMCFRMSLIDEYPFEVLVCMTGGKAMYCYSSESLKVILCMYM